MNENVDEGDVVVNSYQKEIFFALQDSDAVGLKAIEDALKRLETGDWGVCANCDSPISASLLNAVPWTRLCVQCQNRVEIYLRREG